MSDKKLRKSVDDLRTDFQGLAEAFAAFREQLSTQQAAAAAERQTRVNRPRNGESPTTDALAARTASAGNAGHVSLFGVYEDTSVAEAPSTYTWTLEQTPVEGLLEFPVEQFAQVLAATGHRQRLSIILMILEAPATANDVVNDLQLGTTGAAYHHLNVLQAAGIVEQRQRGIFSIVPEQVPVLLTIFAALSGGMGIDIARRDDDSGAEPVEEEAETAAVETA